nr:MAG TPA: Receptor recognition protein, Long tail, Helical sandwich, Tail fiber [Caudoviricetes sp.]
MAAGTLSVTNNSKAVVGVGTTFTAFKAGDFLTLVVGQVPYTVAIASIESATALTLVLPFDGPTATGLAWDGVKRDTMSLATMGVTVQAQKALRLMLADENNWRAIFGDEEEIMVTLPNGQVMQGMSWGYLSQLMKEIDPVEMRNLQQKTRESELATWHYRQEVEGFKNDTNTIKTQTDQIKADTQAIHDATNTIKTQTDQIKTDTQGIKDQTDQIKTDTGVIRDEANAAKTEAQAASTAAQGFRDQAKEWAESVNADNLLTKSGNLAGLADLPTSRSNVGLGDADTVTHQSLHLKQNGTKYGGGLESHRNDANGVLLTKSSLNNELVDGKSTTSIATDNHGSSKSAYLTYNEDGLLSGPSEVRASMAVTVRGSESPQIRLTNDAIVSASEPNSVALEHGGDGVTRLIYSTSDGTSQRLEFPKAAETPLALKGGLLWDGATVWMGDFNNVAQGWSMVSGNIPNGPVSEAYGSCFSYCTQGLKYGNLPGDWNPLNIWYRQVFYSSDNKTYSRINTNQGEWQPWSEYTMSAVSDERLKDVLGGLNVEGALDNINRMDFKLFRFKEERNPNKAPTVRRGVISQQIRGIDKEYTKLIGGYYHLDRTPLLLDGLAAIKALRARDEANKAEIAELKAAVEELKAAVAALTKS